MSENKRREMTKVTIEYESKTTVMEVDGLAGVAFKRIETGHEMQCMLVGNMSVKDLIALNQAIEKELLPLLRHETVNDFLGHIKEDN